MPGLREPGVIGFLRPVILLPQGIDERLSPEQLRAVLVHELCHARRRDNLTALFHMAVEIAFWFYPLVWWLGARIIAERERACDEEVLREGNQPRAYAEGIVIVCKHYLQSSLTCAASFGSGSLKHRVEAIMKSRPVIAMTPSKKALLATTAFAAVVLPMAWGILHSSVARAQAPIDNAADLATLTGQLQAASERGNASSVRDLLAKGASVNFQDYLGETALTRAARNGHLDVVKVLLASGARVDPAIRHGGWTPLMIATQAGHGRVVNALLQAGADVNHQGGAGYSALMLAAADGTDLIVRLLLDHQATIDQQNALGETALFFAARAGHAEVVGLLLDHGADIHHKRGFGETALDLAAQRQDIATVRVLLANGADRSR